MKKLNKMLLFVLSLFGLTLINANATTYTNSKRVNFNEIKANTNYYDYEGMYRYKNDTYIVGMDGKSFKLKNADTLSLEEVEAIYSDHLNELYPETLLKGISYDGLYEDQGHQIGMSSVYLNGEPFGGGGQPIEGLLAENELEYFGDLIGDNQIINKKMILTDINNAELNDFEYSYYFINTDTLKLDKTVSVNDIEKKVSFQVKENETIVFYPFMKDNVTDPYFLAMTLNVDEYDFTGNVAILDYNLNEILSCPLGDKYIEQIVSLHDNSFLLKLTDNEDNYFLYTLSKDKGLVSFKDIEDYESVNINNNNGIIVIDESDYGEAGVISLYDQDLTLLKTYDKAFSVIVYKEVIKEKDLLTTFDYYGEYNADIFNQKNQHILNNGKYLVMVYDEEYDISSMELMTVEDSKKTSISGYIKDSNGNPLKGYIVELHSTPRTYTTDKDGYFKFDNVEEGEHTLIVKDSNGKVLVTKELNVIEGTETKLDEDTLYFNPKDEGFNLNIKVDGDKLVVDSVDKGVKEPSKNIVEKLEEVVVPKTFDGIMAYILIFGTLIGTTIYLNKKNRRIKYTNIK